MSARPLPAGDRAGGPAVRGGEEMPRAAGRAARVIVISSPSGGGKTTVVRRLLRRVPRLARSVSVTTRAPRPGERRGVDYEFLSPAAFRRLRRTGALLESANVHGAWYGTPKRPVLDALRDGRDVILSIDVQGARRIRRALGRRAVLIFLLPPSMDQLKARLLGRRTDTAAAIRRRLAAARRELACAAWYDHQIVNDRLSSTVARVKAVLGALQRKGQ